MNKIKEKQRFMEEVYCRHERLMYYIAGKYTESPVEREDIVQAAVLSLLRNEATTNVFNIQLDTNLSRTFCDMKLRNNPTPWIDKAKQALLQRMRTWRPRNKK